MNKIIPVYRPSLLGNEKKYVNECLDSSWISSNGKFIEKFEQEFAQYLNMPFATSVTNGTVALHLALVALGIGKDDEVILPSFTYVASANAISYCGAKPIFVDSLPDTWQMNPKEVAEKITTKTKAIMAVHLYGHPCEMAELVKLSKKHNLFLIEDCAEALGSAYQSRLVGTFGDVATFSFYGNKTITTGEGGMVVTPHADLFQRAQKLKAQGCTKEQEYWHDSIGYNYRMTNISAAIGLAQLERIDKILAQKKQVATWYEDSLKDLPLQFHHPVGDVNHSYWMCSILFETKKICLKLRQELQQAGIETRPLFYPVTTMPMYADKGNDFPVASDVSSRGINLPSWPDLKREQVEFITHAIGEALLINSNDREEGHATARAYLSKLY